jgi:hypothetical protein
MWWDESSFTLFPASGRVYVGTPKEAYNPECLLPTVKQGRFCDGLGRNIRVNYYLGPIITLHGRITAREYVDRLGNKMHPMIQTLFPNNDTVLQDHNVPIHTAGTVQSWFGEHGGELQHLLWPAQSSHLNIIESVLETKLRN